MLERDAEAASRGVFDDLFGLVVEVVVPQAVRRERSQGGERWVYGRIHSSDRRTWTWPRSSRGPSGARSRGVYRADEHVTLWKGCRKQGGRLVQGREEVFANMCQRALNKKSEH